MTIRQIDLPADPTRADAVTRLLEHAARVDGVDPFSEQFLLGLRDTHRGHRHLLAVEGEEVRGVAAFDGAAWEMAVDPEYRRHGIGAALLAEMGRADVWAHGNLPAAQALAAGQGRQMTRRLLVMAIEGQALHAVAHYEPREDVEALDLPGAVERFGRDHVEEAWLAANNDAFSWHPEQGGWDCERLARAQEVDWFAPEDVLFLVDATTAQLAGFHWTKWHTEVSPAFGEVYVVGLASAFRGRGLGGPLLRLGLEHMVSKGADRVILYVEADNAPAVKVYEDLGFVIAEEHVVWGLSG
ncbi:mycothiol synthase [Corynebacterium sp.]|uniref:mycothiol synthase n=1 Tax=Corynebacterium sp. TaxID=1720 RepID=UPI0026E00802|nr:mycothiol synthase [Corynebacterium sp.]MDO5512373.1 mycothiol synthase [Corynebacterium sp.]